MEILDVICETTSADDKKPYLKTEYS